MVTFIFFCFAVVGLTNIITDPATIVQPIRDCVNRWAENSKFWLWVDKLMSCYQCTGFWVGLFCGVILISHNPFVVFLCGPAGSFIATWGASYLNYLEARSIVADLNDE